MKIYRVIGLSISALVLAVLGSSASVSALSGSDFDRTRIIDDNVFTNPYVMSIQDIQLFLNSRMPDCDENGEEPSEYGGGTRAQYGASRGNPAPFTCLKDYHEVPKTTPGPAVPSSNYGGVAIPSGAKSAANLIYDAAVEYRISPRVLLITLQKEQGLLGDEWPFRNQYLYAMGAHCPDGPNGEALCDQNYSGFSLQIRESAELFRWYLDSMDESWWSYKKPGPNSILYNVAGSTQSNGQPCGSSIVNIQNKATAALYTYTPYQPNAAALANLFGTGDSCSAYGNRNFWRDYTVQFGSTTGSYLLKAANNPTVYLIAGDYKYTVINSHQMNALSPLGAVQVVEQSYLDTKVTQGNLSRAIKGTGPTIYFFEGGMKLPFTSCEQVTHWGLSCEAVSVLEDHQVALLAPGPNMTKNVVTKESGKLYTMQNGQRRESPSKQMHADNGFPDWHHLFSEGAVSWLPVGDPVLSNATLFQERGGASGAYFYESSAVRSVNTALFNDSKLKDLSKGALDRASINRLTAGSPVGTHLRDGATSYVIASSGKIAISNSDEWSATFANEPTFLSVLPLSPTVFGANTFVKSKTSPTVYVIDGVRKYPISSWADLVTIGASSNVVIYTIPAAYLDALPSAEALVAPGKLFKSPTSPVVYIADGVLKKRVLNSFGPLEAAGISTTITVRSQAEVDGYETVSPVMGRKLRCNAENMLAYGGSLHVVSPSQMVNYGYLAEDFIALDQRTCTAAKYGAELTARYIKSPTSAVLYYVEAGQKRSFGNYPLFLSHGGTATNLFVMDKAIVDALPNGPAI